MRLSPPLTAALGTLSLASLGHTQSESQSQLSHETSSSSTLTDTAIAAQPPLVPTDYTCNHPPFRVQIVSTSPLFLYLRGFLTETETRYLKAYSDATLPLTPNSGDRSKSLERDDVVRCLQDRLLELQGYDMDRTHVEAVQLVRSVAGDAEKPAEVDWFSAADMKNSAAVGTGGNRVSSLLAWVSVSGGATGGGVNFPLVDAPRDERWCDVVECDVPWEAGVTFRAVEGNAIYWRDLNETGQGDRRVARAAVPLTSGDEASVDLWTRQGMLAD